MRSDVCRTKPEPISSNRQVADFYQRHASNNEANEQAKAVVIEVIPRSNVRHPLSKFALRADQVGLG